MAGKDARCTGLEAQAAPYYLSASSLDASGSVTEEILYYMDFHQPSYYEFPLPEGAVHSGDDRSLGNEGAHVAGNVWRKDDPKARWTSVPSLAVSARPVTLAGTRKSVGLQLAQRIVGNIYADARENVYNPFKDNGPLMSDGKRI
jgi:hypothetical protein